MNEKPKRWSYSSLSTYKQCPAKWKFSYIDGIEWPASAAMLRGTRMHSMAEDFLNGTLMAVPHEIRKSRGMAASQPLERAFSSIIVKGTLG